MSRDFGPPPDLPEGAAKGLRLGMRVRTRCVSTGGFMLSPGVLSRRRGGIVGTLHSPVPGHGGDVWWVVHEGTSQHEENGRKMWDPSGVAPYGIDELQPCSNED